MLFFCVFRTVCCVGMFGGTENIGLGCSAFFSEHIQPRKSGSFLALRQLSDLQVRFFFPQTLNPSTTPPRSRRASL